MVTHRVDTRALLQRATIRPNLRGRPLGGRLFDSRVAVSADPCECFGLTFASSSAATGYANSELPDRIIELLDVGQRPHGRILPKRSRARPCRPAPYPVLDDARSGLFGKRTRARRIRDSVVQSKNLASRLCDLIVTHRFDDNFRIELLPVRQGVA